MDPILDKGSLNVPHARQVEKLRECDTMEAKMMLFEIKN